MGSPSCWKKGFSMGGAQQREKDLSLGGERKRQKNVSLEAYGQLNLQRGLT